MFQKASSQLRAAADGARLAPPRRLVAVLRMDGDALGRLILGDPRVIHTSWDDVLHPRAVEQVEAKLAHTGWPGLLGERRHMGPALHAAISRSLADFAHRMVAWVVEREYNGRLVYTGGDDLLALLPAVEAIPAAARLQQLFSAPYVLDTDAAAEPWAWRRGGAPGSTMEAHQRFRVPEGVDGEIRLSQGRFEPHSDGDLTSKELHESREVALHPMLGRGHSLSAGVAIAHYKTPLGLLLKTAGELLDRDAKEILGRSALAVALLSRSGTKATFAGRWRVDESSVLSAVNNGRGDPLDPAPPDVQSHFKRVLLAFEPRPRESKRETPAGRIRLAGRLPYKLRERIERMGTLLVDERAEPGKLVRGLIELESGLARERAAEPLIDSTAKLVECGLHYARSLRAARSPAGNDLPQLAVAGLLVARKLAADGGNDGPA